MRRFGRLRGSRGQLRLGGAVQWGLSRLLAQAGVHLAADALDVLLQLVLHPEAALQLDLRSGEAMAGGEDAGLSPLETAAVAFGWRFKCRFTVRFRRGRAREGYEREREGERGEPARLVLHLHL